MWGEAKGTGLVQPGEKKAWRKPDSSFPKLKWDYQENGATFFIGAHGRGWETTHSIEMKNFS